MRSNASEHVRPRRREVVAAWFARHRYVGQLLVLVVVGIFLFVGTYLLFPRTENGTFLREIVIAALGALITVITAGVALAGPVARLMRDRRQSTALTLLDTESWHRSAIQVGRMRIPDIVVVASADKGKEWTDSVDLTFTDFASQRPDPPEMATLREHRLPELQRRAEAQGVTLTNEPCVDLVAAGVRMRTDEQGRRRTTYELTPAMAYYFDFSITTARLDAPLPAALDTNETLRQRWATYPAAIEHVRDLPAMAKLGSSTVVVTADHRLVLGVRGKTFVAGSADKGDARSAVHVVAEGVVPGDLNRRGYLDPAVTARRGLHEELNIGDPERGYGRIEELRAVGFFFDQLRWQPCFAYLARIDLTWDELQTLAPTAGSYWEVERLASLPFHIEHPEVHALLLDEHPRLTLASNHAAAALWFALLHQHGLFTMRHELTMNVRNDESASRAKGASTGPTVGAPVR